MINNQQIFMKYNFSIEKLIEVIFLERKSVFLMFEKQIYKINIIES